MQITGIVVEKAFNKLVKSRSGASYEAWELVYKDSQTDEIKPITKPMQSLAPPRGVPLKAALDALSPGDRFVCELVKEGNFWEIKSLTKGELAVPLPQKKSWSGGGNSQRDYETKEERTSKQKLIVAQSSLTAAVETLANTKGKSFSKDEVKELAQEYFDWVFTRGN